MSFCYHWDPDSVKTRGEYTFAYFTNEHSASYLLTRPQLGRAIESGGFLVEPHEGRYDGECAASTDPYTQCGFKKMVCLSSLDDFLIRHLPGNKFTSRPYAARAEFQMQIDALLEMREDGRPRTLLFDPETKILHAKWSKDYYEPVRPEILSLMPEGARSVLSIGCGWGSDGRPSCAERPARGRSADGFRNRRLCRGQGRGDCLRRLQNRPGKAGSRKRFDCILLSNVLHLVRDPVAVLSSIRGTSFPAGRRHREHAQSGTNADRVGPAAGQAPIPGSSAATKQPGCI